MATTEGNHGKVEECVEALQREVSALRAALDEHAGHAEQISKRNVDSRPRWKFRTAWAGRHRSTGIETA